MWLWDTNILDAFADSSEYGHERVVSRARAVGWENNGLPIIVVVEAIEGRLRYLRESQRRSPVHLVPAYEHLTATLGLVTGFPIVPFDRGALDIFARSQLFSGTMGRADRLIAAIAIAGGHHLVTRNVAHFRDVSGLVIENWIDEPG